ncbi:MAG: ATP-binding cassette domain-containing protein [Coriobacteriaceae bacterium]|nr:ATP-binding cassette domain-containing protein [Coriobacteriaceae bacterium]
MAGARIHIEDTRFSYGRHEALRGVTLDIAPGEHVCVLGGNGSGKSTLLQLMNALLLPDAGTVRVDGADTATADGALLARRRAAMVFQHPEDQMVTSIVADDVAFGPENLGVEPQEIARRVGAALAAVSMTDAAHRDPADLSGGQKQRIAIAGALAMEPRALLLDEPCAMLDAAGRREIQRIIARLNAQGITIVHVTHFMDDALAADRVVVMDHGQVALEGSPAEVFGHHRLIEGLGLELPFCMRLASALRARGIDAPFATEDRELVRWASSQGAVIAAAPATEPPAGTAAARADAGVSFENVSFSYAARGGSHGNAAVEGLDLAVAAGTLTALVGRTGSGKSTTAELACALKVPTKGSVRVAGIDTTDRRRRRALRRQVGYVSQLPERQLFAATVLEDVMFGPLNLGATQQEASGRAREALTMVGLDPVDELLNRSPFALSGGQQRSVALAGILAMRQPILVLDEPMAGLDPAGRAHMRRILAKLKRAGTTLLLITHSMDDAAELADRIAVLDEGRLVAEGTPREVFEASAPRTPGLPAPLAFARALTAEGSPAPLAGLPLTLDALADAIAAALKGGGA